MTQDVSLSTTHAELAPEVTQMSTALAMLKRTTITDQPTLDWVVSLTRSVKERYKALEAKRTEITKPILEGKRKVDELFAPALKGLLAIESEGKRLMGDYGRAQEKAKGEAMLAASATYQSGGAPLVGDIPESVEVKGVTIKHSWIAIVMAQDLVPREMCSPDPVKIQDYARQYTTEFDPPAPVPGLRFELTSQTIVRQK